MAGRHEGGRSQTGGGCAWSRIPGILSAEAAENAEGAESAEGVESAEGAEGGEGPHTLPPPPDDDVDRPRRAWQNTTEHTEGTEERR